MTTKIADNNFKNKKVLVTGGTGFIGRVLVDALLGDGARVMCLSRHPRHSKIKKLKYIKCDLGRIGKRQGRALVGRIGKVDMIVYLAASIPPVARGKETMLEAKANNLDTFVNFLDIFGGLSDMFVLTSSIDVYGYPRINYFSESAPVAPQTSYAVAKLCAEKYLEYYCSWQNKDYNILRLAQVYGPCEPLVRVTPIIIDALRRDREFVLSGGGRDKRRLLYMDDAVLAIKKAMLAPRNDIFNIAGREDLSISDIIKETEKVFHRRLKLKIVEGRKKPVNILPDFSKAKKQLGFYPSVTLRRGMRLIVAGIRYEEE